MQRTCSYDDGELPYGSNRHNQYEIKKTPWSITWMKDQERMTDLRTQKFWNPNHSKNPQCFADNDSLDWYA